MEISVGKLNYSGEKVNIGLIPGYYTTGIQTLNPELEYGARCNVSEHLNH